MSRWPGATTRIQRDVDVRGRSGCACAQPGPCARMLATRICKTVPVHIPPDEHVGWRLSGCVSWVMSALVELKCPGMVNHILTCADGGVPAAYRMQSTGPAMGYREEVGRLHVVYHPDAPEQILEYASSRTRPCKQAFDDVIPAFVAELAESRRNLLDRGWKSWKDQHDDLGRAAEDPDDLRRGQGRVGAVRMASRPWHERIMAEHDRRGGRAMRFERMSRAVGALINRTRWPCKRCGGLSIPPRSPSGWCALCICSGRVRKLETLCAVLYPHRPAYWIPLPCGALVLRGVPPHLDRVLNRLAPQYPTSQDGRTCDGHRHRPRPRAERLRALGRTRVVLGHDIASERLRYAGLHAASDGWVDEADRLRAASRATAWP